MIGNKNKYAKGGEIKTILEYQVEEDADGSGGSYANLDEAEMHWESLSDKQRKEGTLMKNTWECEDGVCDIVDTEIIYAKGGKIKELEKAIRNDYNEYDDDELDEVYEYLFNKQPSSELTDGNRRNRRNNLLIDKLVEKEIENIQEYGYSEEEIENKIKTLKDKFDYAKGGEVKKKGNEMLIGGLAGILLGIFLNK